MLGNHLLSLMSFHRFFRFRERYWFTKSNRLRLRYSFVLCLAALGGLFASEYVFNIPFASTPIAEARLVGSSKTTTVAGIEPAAGVVGVDVDGKNSQLADSFAVDAASETSASLQPRIASVSPNLKARISDSMRLAPSLLKKAEKPDFVKVSIKKGDTIAGALQRAGVDSNDAYYAVKALSKSFDPRKVKPGQEITVHFHDNADVSDVAAPQFKKLSMKISPVKEILVNKNADQDFSSSVHEKELKRHVYGRYAQVQTSLYGSAARADIPANVIANMIRVYSWNVDFQRDIRRGDKIEVLYEVFETEEGEFVKYGDVLFAKLETNGRSMPIYRFEMDNGRVDYFEPDGTSIRKTLMKTPVDGARISSGFGMRHHPVLGYDKMHKGIDFAAPTGTPIYAAGDAVVEFAGRNGGYGNYVRLRHNSKLKTAYAHMHKFGKGIRQGKTVRQGDVIGYIGTTGRSTGPHLHYEVHVNGKQTNPRSVDLPTGETLQAQELNRFKSQARKFDNEYASLTRGVKFASNEH